MVAQSIVQDLRTRTVGLDGLRQLSVALEGGEVQLRDLVNDLMGSLTYANAQIAMSSLEWLADLDSKLALVLMAGLYGSADGLRAHDICDAIELWLENVGDQDLIAPLRRYTSRGDIAPAKAAEWISMLESKPAR